MGIVNHTYEDILNFQHSNGNMYHKTVKERLQKSSCPITIRKCIEADISAALRKHGETDGQSMRIKSFVACTVGTIGCIPTRIFRAAFRTAILIVPIGPLYALGKASRYHLEGEVKDHCKHTGEEWVDLGAALAGTFIAACKVFKKDAFHDGVGKLEVYYLKRAFKRLDRDELVEAAKKRHREHKKMIKNAWKNGTAPVPFSAADANINIQDSDADDDKRPLIDDRN